jgi:predicted PurR-regulated permease PerM
VEGKELAPRVPKEKVGWSARRALFVLLIGSLVLVALVVRPLAIALFLAAVLAGALWPLQARLAAWFRGRSALAAGTLIVGVTVLGLAPLVALSTFVVKEGAETMKFVSKTVRQEGVEGLVARLPGPLESATRKVIERLPVESGQGLEAQVQQQVSERGGKAAAVVGAAVAATGSLLLQAALMLIALYFFLTEKRRILDWIDEASPLAKGQTHELLGEFRNVSVAVLRSSVLTAGVQALAALAGYFIAKVPYPIFFGAVTFFVALIPAIGAASVCLVTAGLLLATGHPMAALFLAIWGVVVVGLSDNLVKPLLIRRGVELHGAVVFFSLLGGLGAFGTIGLLLGPLIIALFVAVLRIYRRDYGDGGARVVRPDEPDAHARVESPAGAPARPAGNGPLVPRNA